MTLHALLTAPIKAYEIQGVLQIANALNEYGLDHTILVKVASTALAIAQQLGLRSPDCRSRCEGVACLNARAAMEMVHKHGKLLNAADRDHCLQYIIAVIMLKGSVIDAGDYMDESPWAQDPRVDHLREKITVVEDEGFPRDYYDQKVRSGANAILLELSSGERLHEVVVEFPIGHPKRPDTWDLVKEKFQANMDTLFSKGEVEKISFYFLLAHI